jgi:endonuclease/exonuclease/phosphatase family metal-dependent hydrolase
MHAKSKRDREGDRESLIWRTAQINNATEILEDLSLSNPKTPFVWGGDFNTGMSSSEMNAVSESFEDVFNATPDTVARNDRVTHTYHPKRGSTHKAQMDGLFVRNTRVITARIYRYRNTDGSVKPIPDTIEERNENPSDHFPIYSDFEITGF